MESKQLALHGAGLRQGAGETTLLREDSIKETFYKIFINEQAYVSEV